MPLSAGVDAVFRDKTFGYQKIIAAIMILWSFLLMLIPNESLDKMEVHFNCFLKSKRVEKKVTDSNIIVE